MPCENQCNVKRIAEMKSKANGVTKLLAA